MTRRRDRRQLDLIGPPQSNVHRKQREPAAFYEMVLLLRRRGHSVFARPHFHALDGRQVPARVIVAAARRYMDPAT